ncbi:hypothetical protein Anas_13994 [Armadillidium nasatum]|uniref:C2H2-type domain-containing protein n=1 Tax=Armadillidium nasatum TaxID=96803 RepID=A0A5N5T6D9_9CRUS|nr:hypothetical protein Anas_13994 [Armadillidium nasatum]
MDHFLSGLEGHNASSWYAARSSVHSQAAHEFAVGSIPVFPDSFQLIPISGGGIMPPAPINPIKSNAGSLDLTTATSESSSSSSGLALLKASSAASTVASMAAAAVAASNPRTESQIKEEVEILEEKSDPTLEGFPMGSSHSSPKKKSGSKWDTKKACNICDKMQRHELIHKVEKPWTCVPCNLEFVRQEGFNAHMEKKHPERLPYTLIQHPRTLHTSTSSSPPPANSEYHLPEGINSSLSHMPVSSSVSEPSKSITPSTSSDYVTISNSNKTLSLLSSRLPPSLLPQP